MITLYLIHAILIAHFISDFTYHGWKKKCKGVITRMAIHSIIYTISFGIIFYIATFNIYDHNKIITYIIVNGLLHYSIDLLCYKIKSLQPTYVENDEDGFFPSGGLEQLTHLLILFHTFFYIF